MIITKYPDYVEDQLIILDEKIMKIHTEEMQRCDIAKIRNVEEQERIKRNIFERTKPLVDEKVRLITNCVPTYIVKKEW